MLAVDYCLAGCGPDAASSRHIQFERVSSIHVGHVVENTYRLIVGALHEGHARGIAKENGGGAVLIIGDRSHFVRAANKHGLRSATFNKSRGHNEGHKEAAASGGKVKSPCIRSSESSLHDGGRGRKNIIRSHGGNNDAINIGGRESPVAQALPCGRENQVRGAAGA